ncbi:hypothetical protein ANCDUO_20245 [Ancylostoma duodenale]|uniref:Uncharacterized protein n=1 Tax=Ancylostoma duodenale TaxID=51022 RepID=A0A0C2FSP2_9BILA|nr:hypothetical protein ANCDUO_20245 [Ancylostoma duodenale]
MVIKIPGKVASAQNQTVTAEAGVAHRRKAVGAAETCLMPGFAYDVEYVP